MKPQTMRLAELAHQAARKGLTLEKGGQRYTLRWPDGRTVVALYTVEILASIIAHAPEPSVYAVGRDE